MQQIHFDPTNQEAMNAMMDEHGKSKTMYPGTNEHGESVYISIFEDKIVFHVHDECVMEMLEGTGSVEEACAIMGQPPEWCSDLPLRADGYECRSYRKA